MLARERHERDTNVILVERKRKMNTPKNILVHDGKLLIADFGLSKDETSKPSSDSFHGVQAYIDPQCFIGPQCLENVSYKRSKKSDIYGFGVILWEISSGRPPFQSFAKIPYGIVFHVSKGGREKPVEGTPDSYIQIYERCWNYDPNQRPEFEEIQENLLNLLRKENFGNQCKTDFDDNADFYINDDPDFYINVGVEVKREMRTCQGSKLCEFAASELHNQTHQCVDINSYLMMRISQEISSSNMDTNTFE
ncbi:kinase-like domain-containing protein [Gigaspora rosea]|uniref:Kinase-like domain-containing protein n=1 Tax=Gigaspora rosea TaxID=44941 RepID=A0A397UV53_9GLOM|nr:kinase-like domain-containing protein [Gigaspora rosea]